ncbi:MAG TPA: hypothetical protein VLA13_01770 [Massilibacterium sp.]|nr:hypothetical protein [Massilibacterium sp.]
MSQDEFSKGRERWHIQKFKECYHKISEMETICDENPDFILKNDSETIGIEHRRVVKPSDEKGFDLKQEEKVQQKTLNLACEKFYLSTGKYVWVTVLFANRTKINAKQLAPVIAKIVENNIPRKDTSKEVKKYDKDFNKLLPDEINKIKIYSSENLEGNYWSFVGAGFNEYLEPDLVQKAINDKNDKLPNYRETHPECLSYWLLLTIHGFRSSSWFKIADDFNSNKFKFDFDKVFLFDVQEMNYYKLKNR